MALFTFDPSTNRGKVRLLIADDVEAFDGVDVYHFTDEKIDAFLTIASSLDGDTVYHASAQALESWASNQVMILKVVKQLDTQTDGAKVSQEMRERAKVYRELAQSLSTDSGFDFAEMVVNQFSYREQIRNRAINEG